MQTHSRILMIASALTHRTSLVELEVVGQRIIVTEAVDTVPAITTEEINQISVHPKSR